MPLRSMLPLSRPPLALALLALFAACTPPLQNGGVDVREGAAARLETLCRWRHAAVEGENPCASSEQRAAPSRVKRIAAEADKLSGPFATGRVGDYLLENDEIAVVIDQLGRGGGFAESGGNIVDAADARARRDELGQMFTSFGAAPRQAIYEAIESGVDPKGTAWIEVRGHELYEKQLRITTRYELSAGQRSLVISTELENKKSAPISGLSLGDTLQWGLAEKFAPGQALGFKGDVTAPYLGGAGRQVAYGIIRMPHAALTPERAPEAGISSTSTAASSDLRFARDVSLASGQRAAYQRVLVVGPRGDSLGVVTEMFFLQGGAPGGVEVELVDPAGARLAPPEGGRILLAAAAPDRQAAAPPLWIQIGSDMAKAGANAAAELPPGRYLVGFEGAGRLAKAKVPVSIESGKVAKIALAVSAAGAVQVSLLAREGGSSRASPGKVQIFTAASGEPVRAPVLAPVGAAEIPVAEGRYRVVASRGPEFSIAEQTIDVASGKSTAVELILDRVVKTPGFIGCDLHQHSAPSFDAGVSVSERVVSNVVEGVECAVASERNAVVDMTPIVVKLGLEPYLRTLVGVELASDASREPFGHVNAFPLPIDPSDARGGAFPVRDRTAKEAFDSILALPGEHVIQVNHPRLDRFGYFEKLRFDPRTGVGAAPGYDGRFDAIEVWTGRRTGERAKGLADLWALYRTSHPVTPTANSDTHGIVGQEAGYPRTYVRVPDDDPARLDVGALVRGLRELRSVVLTNGPFVTMSAGEVEQGGLLSLRPRKAGAPGRATPEKLSIHVERAPWVDVSELVLWVSGVAGKPIALPGKTSPTGARVDDVSIQLVPSGKRAFAGASDTIEIAEDTFLVATVLGKQPLTPVLTGDAAEILPFAMTAPIWIDADGDGRALGR
jgi:hypothetical protein